MTNTTDTLVCADCSSLGTDRWVGSGEPPTKGTCGSCDGPWPARVRPPMYVPHFRCPPPYMPIGPIIEANSLKDAPLPDGVTITYVDEFKEAVLTKPGESLIASLKKPKCPSCGSNPDVDCICKGP